ncbi:unnamed protein product [Rotaria sp. Silwood2]|nr:unnamed protein product [Rotaria sp. Silwood2]CAF4294077.1 unnamed protein product [Rotaria sp. Silwood2]CAF4419941.1 unnamed protein product [Rotaria sp. Silwood2]CAF4485260.1 unnamed protein product [Rotaria sp. Silwood2]
MLANIFLSVKTYFHPLLNIDITIDGKYLTFISNSSSMNPRLSDEAKAFCQLAASIQLLPNNLTPESLRTLIENLDAKGVDRTAKVCVAGDSSGAMIGTSVYQMVKNIDFQILVYGLYDFIFATPSVKEFYQPQFGAVPGLFEWYAWSILELVFIRK